jgi:hypothetical protein
MSGTPGPALAALPMTQKEYQDYTTEQYNKLWAATLNKKDPDAMMRAFMGAQRSYHNFATAPQPTTVTVHPPQTHQNAQL